jgi:hypothetical protein
MLELIPMRLLLPKFRGDLRGFFTAPVILFVARRANSPLPATPYIPPCGVNFQQNFGRDVSNRELIPAQAARGHLGTIAALLDVFPIPADETHETSRPKLGPLATNR